MLAQSFMTHTDLGVTAEEHTALIKVLGMLERGELVHDASSVRISHGFNMGVWGHDCGTTACIGGWVASLIGKIQEDYVCGVPKDHCLNRLYWPEEGVDVPNFSAVTPTQAAFALRSFLSTGKPNWAEAMA